MLAETNPDAGVFTEETLKEAEVAGATHQTEEVHWFDAPVASHPDPNDLSKDAGEQSFAAEAEVGYSAPTAPFASDDFAPSSADPSGPSSAAHPGGAHDEPPSAQYESGEGSGFVTLSDFTPTEILNHLIHNDVYFGKGWGELPFFVSFFFCLCLSP